MRAGRTVALVLIVLAVVGGAVVHLVGREAVPESPYTMEPEGPLARVRIVAPRKAAGVEGRRGVVVVVPPDPADPDAFEKSLAKDGRLAELAGELNAAFAIVMPKTDTADAVVREIVRARRTLLTVHGVDEGRVVVVGVGSGAEAAMEAFTHTAKNAAGLMLVRPVLAEPSGATPASVEDARPVVLLAAKDDPGGARALLHLRARSAQQAILSAEPTGETFPANTLVAFLRLSDATAALENAQPWLGTRDVPGVGQTRIEALRALVAVRDLELPPANAAPEPIALQHAADEALPDDAPILLALTNHTASLDPQVQTAREKALERLAAARTDAEKRLQQLARSLAKAPKDRRAAALATFRAENFAFPDLCDSAALTEPPVTEAEFMAVIRPSCARCHRKECASVAALRTSGWLRPGKPDQSRVYTVIGKHKKPGDKHHNLPEKDKEIIRRFIEELE